MAEPSAEADGQFRREIGLFDATMLVMGTMIGSGIFIVSTDIAATVGSSGWLLAVWVLTGVMTILGALCYAELAGMMPDAGGQYVYLETRVQPRLGLPLRLDALHGHSDWIDRRRRGRLHEVPRRLRTRRSAPTSPSRRRNRKPCQSRLPKSRRLPTQNQHARCRASTFSRTGWTRDDKGEYRSTRGETCSAGIYDPATRPATRRSRSRSASSWRPQSSSA